MLANPGHSRLVLINPARGELGNVSAEFLARRAESLSLLPKALKIVGVTLYTAGDPLLEQLPVELAEVANTIDVNVLSLWSDQGLKESLAASEVGVVFLGGAWLEEDVLIAALEGVELGYDVRVLADISVARIEADRSLVLHRLALHGVPATTVRQALLEWATWLKDPDLRLKIQQMLA
jgi:nicotinamidase-related amidase